MEEVAKKIFTSNVGMDNGIVVTPMGERQSEMTLFVDGNWGVIEWEVEDVGIESIGLYFKGKALDNYDGVYSIPKEAVEMLRENGFTVSDEFLED
jgi:hypothetical protein